MEPLSQCAALPCVEIEGKLHVLLVTTRGRGRWTIPKGWPKRNKDDPDLAATEAFEEAGVAGEIRREPIGSYLYTKRLHLFSWVRCQVAIYLLHVDRQFLTWPEQDSRKLLWVEPEKAAKLVRDRQLAEFLRSPIVLNGVEGL
jgi:8-oxo-dGTP pyrophosphatase MutT (NUDIX family)